MTAGDTNGTLVFAATYCSNGTQQYSYTDFTGAQTVTLICGASDCSVSRKTYNCLIAENDATVSYTPIAPTDFPVSGQYWGQLLLTYPDGGTLHSQPFTFIVYPAY